MCIEYLKNNASILLHETWKYLKNIYFEPL